MKKIQKHIEIVRSTISELSSLGRTSAEGIQTLLAQHYATVGITTVNNASDLQRLVLLQPDLVFVGMRFVPTDDTLGLRDPHKLWLADFLDEHQIAYTGSGHAAHELELDKSLAKQRAQSAGLQTSPFRVALQGQLAPESDLALTFPVFIKPTDRGGGAGVDTYSLAHTYADAVAKVQSLMDRMQADSLVEEYLPGREFSVAILKDEHVATYSLMPLELIAPADEHGIRILSSKIKSADTERFAPLTDEVLRKAVTALAIDVFHALGARDYGRIDIRLDVAGNPHFLEANLIPSLLNHYGNFPKACLLNADMDYETMLLHIVRLGFAKTLAPTLKKQTSVLYGSLFAPAPAVELA